MFKQLAIVALLLFGLSTPCLAEPNKSDAVLFILRAVDWRQTTVIATKQFQPGWYNWDDGSKYVYSEANPILGKHPDKHDVDRYFASLILIDMLIAEFGPEWLHKSWNSIHIGAELFCVDRNYKVGIRIKF